MESARHASPFKRRLTRAGREKFGLHLCSPLKEHRRQSNVVKPLTTKCIGGATAARAESRKVQAPRSVKTPLSFSHIRFDFDVADSPSNNKRKREHQDDVGPVPKKPQLFSIPADLPNISHGAASPFKPPASTQHASEADRPTDLPLLTIRSPPTSPVRAKLQDVPNDTVLPRSRATSDSQGSTHQSGLGIGIPGVSGATSPRRWSLGEAMDAQGGPRSLTSNMGIPSMLSPIKEAPVFATPRSSVSSLRSTNADNPLYVPSDLLPPSTTLHTPVVLTPEQRLAEPNPFHSCGLGIPSFAFIEATPLPPIRPPQLPLCDADLSQPPSHAAGPSTLTEGWAPPAADDPVDVDEGNTSHDITVGDVSFSSEGMSEAQAARLANFTRMMQNYKQPRRLSATHPLDASLAQFAPAAGSSKLPVPSHPPGVLPRTRSGRQPPAATETKPRRPAPAPRKGSLLPLASASNAVSAMVEAEGGTAAKADNPPLRGVVAFVDSRTTEGDDASTVFVSMLELLGAKVTHRITSQLTHIIFKNGRPATVNRYFALPQPRPLLVGIGWVVRCKQENAKIPEKDYMVELSRDLFPPRRKIVLPKVAPAHQAKPSTAVQALEQTNQARIQRATRFKPRVGSPLRNEAKGDAHPLADSVAAEDGNAMQTAQSDTRVVEEGDP